MCRNSKKFNIVEVSEVCEIVGGGTPSTKVNEFFGGNITWLTPADLTDYNKKYISGGRRNLTKAGLNNSSAKLLPKGSVLFSSRAPIGYVAIADRTLATNQGFRSLVPNEEIFNEYLYYFLKSAKHEAERLASGTTFKEISGKNLGKLKIPIFPLPTQHSIVEKIEELFSELDHGVENLKKAQQQLKTYRLAVLKDAFEGKLTKEWREQQDDLPTPEELLQQIKAKRKAHRQRELAEWEKELEQWEKDGKPGRKPRKPRKPKSIPKLTNKDINSTHYELPKSWKWCQVNDLGEDIFDGPFGSNLKTKDYTDSGVRVIRLENIGWLNFKNEEKTYISEEKYETLKKHTVRKGDIIFSSFIADQTRVVLLPDYINRAVNKADCFCIRPFTVVSSKYLTYYLATRQTYALLENEVHGATRPRINTTQLKSLLVPLCSEKEQVQIVNEIESRFSVVDQLEQTIKENLQKAEALRQSILKKAFSGELVKENIITE